MRKRKTIITSEYVDSGVSQHEDAVLKTCMQFFAEELLPYLKIKGKVVSFAPTELVRLEVQKLFQDFNLVMDDGSWLHFEFQSKNEGINGLKRFRVYEAITSYQYGVSVSTYVLYSGSIKKPVTAFTEGFNTYRVFPIIMRDRNADELIQGLWEKLERGEKLVRSELVPLVLSPLMSGQMTQKERLLSAYRLVRNADSLDESDMGKLEAVIYAMADKFLEKAELEELKEEVRMTKLGQMLVNDGIEQGMARGMERGMRALVNTCQELGIIKKDTVQKVAQGFEMSQEEARKNVEKYWK